MIILMLKGWDWIYDEDDRRILQKRCCRLRREWMSDLRLATLRDQVRAGRVIFRLKKLHTIDQIVHGSQVTSDKDDCVARLDAEKWSCVSLGVRERFIDQVVRRDGVALDMSTRQLKKLPTLAKLSEKSFA